MVSQRYRGTKKNPGSLYFQGFRGFLRYSHSVPWLLSQLFSMLFGIIIRQIPTQLQRFFDLWWIRVLFVYHGFRRTLSITNAIFEPYFRILSQRAHYRNYSQRE